MSSEIHSVPLGTSPAFESYFSDVPDYFTGVINAAPTSLLDNLRTKQNREFAFRRSRVGRIVLLAGLGAAVALSLTACGESNKPTSSHQKANVDEIGVGSFSDGGVSAIDESPPSPVTTKDDEVPPPEENTPDTDGSPVYRFVSMPDFTNADLGDLRQSPYYDGSIPNSISPFYDRTFNTILSAVRNERVKDVFMAGDFVEGEWGKDPEDLGVFGPVGTTSQKRRALQLAGSIYYPDLKERFDRHGLNIYPAIGDHEIGDNPWSTDDIVPSNLGRYNPEEFDYLDFKRDNLGLFKRTFSQYYFRNPDGSWRFDNRPDGQASGTSYAVRVQPDVELISLDVFKKSEDGSRIIAEVDEKQLQWLEGVLKRAEEDDVEWRIVQAHTPILEPVRKRHSSGLEYENSADSDLWRLMEEYKVDLYLAGEVHDITARVEGGVTQISHGGLMFLGEANYLVGDIKGDTMRITTKEFRGATYDDSAGSLTCINRDGYCPARVINYPNRKPVVTGRMVIKKNQANPVSATGRLALYNQR